MREAVTPPSCTRRFLYNREFNRLLFCNRSNIGTTRARIMDNHRSYLIFWMLVVGFCWALGCGSSPPLPRAILQGHKGDVTSVAFGPDGKILASRSSDDTVRIWDVPLRRERMAVSGFPSDMGAVTFSPDGARLATNEASIGAVAWDAASAGNRSDYVYPDRMGPAWSCYSVSYGSGISYSPDGKTLAAGGSNGGEFGFVTLWDVASREGEDLIGRHEEPVTVVAFSPGGETLASAGSEGTIRLWNLATKMERSCLRGHKASVYAVSYSPDGEVLVSASGDHTAKIWDTASGREVGTFLGHHDSIFCIAISPNGRIAASGDRSGAVLLWELSTRRVIVELAHHQGSVLCVAFSPTGDLLASGGKDRMIHLWDIQD